MGGPHGPPTSVDHGEVMVAEVVATETTGEPAAPAPPPPPTGDARLVHRGPIQRLLVRPEIGALLGTTAIWFFFWVVAPIFGTAAGTANYLDVAATLGIMAVAVSLLMIGGEFDLSSGAMTGATAMMVILLSKQLGTGGAGIPLSLAVPLSLAFALTIGWFNGTIVDKTGLPSFIVTLGSYFMLIGAKLSFSKMFVGQVTVAGLDKADGFELLAQDLRRLVDPQRPPLGGRRHLLDRARDRRRGASSSSA